MKPKSIKLLAIHLNNFKPVGLQTAWVILFVCQVFVSQKYTIVIFMSCFSVIKFCFLCLLEFGNARFELDVLLPPGRSVRAGCSVHVGYYISMN